MSFRFSGFGFLPEAGVLGRAFQDTPQVRPCRLDSGHPWPLTFLKSTTQHSGLIDILCHFLK